jgi:hypothetical protein
MLSSASNESLQKGEKSSMNMDGFTAYLDQRKLSGQEIEQALRVAGEFEDFLHRQAKRGKKNEAVRDFSQILIERQDDDLANYYTLIRYGCFIGDEEMTVAAIDLVDGAEALENLHRMLGEKVGTEKRNRIFQDIPSRGLGLPNAEKTRLMQKVVVRMEKEVAPAMCVSILRAGLRSLEGDDLTQERMKYLACETLDEFLEQKGKAYIAELEKLMNDNQLYFTQRITPEVIEFVRSEPLIKQGVRVGNILYTAKIPHQAREYLASRSKTRKRYHYCHCPWVKESLKTGRSKMPSIFCNCSAAFEKHYWEGVLAQPLQAEVLETVLQGDLWCKFAIHLPENVA